MESLVLATLQGFGRIIPMSSETQIKFFQRFYPTALPDDAWNATFALGALIALLLYFVHDWASILSSLIQVTIFRKRPMTLDERYPFFIALCASIPAIALAFLIHKLELPSLFAIQESLASWEIGGLVGGTALLFFAERWSKRNRGPFDLGVLDSIALGVGQLISWIPGIGGTLGMLSVSQLRNYHLEATTKSVCLLSLPFIVVELAQGSAQIHWSEAEPMLGISWLQWGLSLFVCTISAFIALRILNEHFRRTGFKKLIGYRAVVTAIAIGFYFFS
ncbi:MAG: hypothetical protein KGQ59_00720 [Bdellovibrionales bacterium]|nr:hypothetical protein [Bdellovibrionales bacterium]